MMDSVVDWLTRLGLPQYAQPFVENDVDLEVLATLTEADLRELGVASFGHRRKILSAIDALRPSAAAVARPEMLAAPASSDSGERRQLSVMFCDLVGSTALSTRLDPEEMREIIATYQATCAPIIAEYDGAIAKFMGDGILAYFGYPRAHEDDAERAVHAALAMSAAVGRLQTSVREPLNVRVGIATGLVVVGHRIGEGAAQEQAVVGDAPNLAARLQSLAEPGAVVISASTRRLIANSFQVRSLGLHDLKGFSGAIEAWCVQGISNSETRFDSAQARQQIGFVGREKESALLLDRLSTAWRGAGQVVLISGEAGIGKSHFAAWLAEHVAQQPHARIRYQCSPYHNQSALYPVVRQLERSAGLQTGDEADTRLEKLESVLSQATTRVAEVAPLFASLLSIPFGGRYLPLSLSASQQRRLTLAALAEQLEGLARRSPVLVMFEDAHWADATSLELIDLVIESVKSLPVLFLITFRPEFESPWEGLDNVTRINLGKLDQSDVEALIVRMTGGRRLPKEVMQQIVAKTDGVPLFIEEFTKTIEESGILVADGDHYRLDGPLPPLAIPSTLQDSLMARLDRLSPLKETVQTGAAIGREFSYAMIQAVMGQDQNTLLLALAQLEGSGLLFRAGSPPDARYTFKHALLQDAAYESLLKSRRQPLHRRIAERLRDQFAATAAAEPEIVAHHLTLAAMNGTAVEWWGKAGDLAIRRAAFAEAAAHFRKAIENADPIADQSASVPLAARLKLQLAYGQALMHASGWTADLTIAAFARAREMATGIDNRSERLAIYYGLWGGSYVRGELAAMREIAEAFLSDAQEQKGSPEEGVAHRAVGESCWFAGDYAKARKHFEHAVTLYNESKHASLAQVFGQDIGMAASVFLALVLCPIGDIARARQLADNAILLAQRSGHVPTLGYAYFHLFLFESIRDDRIGDTPHAEALFALAQEHKMPIWNAAGTFARGSHTYLSGEQESGLATMRQGLALFRQLGIGAYLPFLGLALARAEGHSSDAAAGLAVVDETLSECERSGQHWLDSELHRLRGDLLLRVVPEEREGAEAAYRRAIAIAKAQGTRVFALRAALGLARMHQGANMSADVSEFLSSALDGLRPSRELPEIAAAYALLDDCSAQTA
jgi:class 3 adenylate cyclase/predicted ATPase/ABC-type transport system involved in cytochrome c biogenesis ATPase subunit